MKQSTPNLQILPTWTLLGAFFLIPLAIVLLLSFRPSDEFGDPAPNEDLPTNIKSNEFTQNYREATTPPIVRPYTRSLRIAIATTIICLLVSYPVAYYIAIVADTRWRNLLLAAVAIPFWTSFVIRVSAWKLILWPLGLGYTQTAVLIGLVYAELPFMILPLYASLEKLDKGLLEAAGDLGASAWSTFWRVTVPLTTPGIVAGVVLVFIPSVGQYVVSDLLGGEKSWLAGNLIQFEFSDITGRKPVGAAVSFLVMSAVMSLLILYAIYTRDRHPTPGQSAGSDSAPSAAPGPAPARAGGYHP
jgi:spermidine/putrescine transport system permease protein